MTVPRTRLVIVLILAFAPALLSAETLVKPETATPIEICPSCTSVRVLLVPDNNLIIKLNEGPKVEMVYFGGSAPRDAAKFPAEWIGNKFPREIKFTLDPDETKQAGTYDLYLNLQPESKPVAERLKLQLIRPAASLEVIPKLIINRTYWLFGLSSDNLPDLRVTETSNKSRVTISGVRPVSNSVIGTKPIGGTLRFPLGQPEIKPGDQVKLNYTLDGGFELGTATGTMKIDAPQLSSPVSFDFEVRSHFHAIWIMITIVVALYISYLLKVKLQHTVDLGQACLDAQKLLDRITREEERHADPDFSTVYRSSLDDLTDAMKGDSASKINDYKVALDTQWQQALHEFANKHQEEQDALMKLKDFITLYEWSVPPAIVQTIEYAKTTQAKVQDMINRGDLNRAKDERMRIIFNLGTEILTAATLWQTHEQQILKMIQTGLHGIPTTIHDLSNAAAGLLSSMHKVDESTKLDTPEYIHATLQCIHSERVLIMDFFVRLSDDIQSECNKAIQLIPNPPPTDWDASIFDKVPAAVNEFRTFLETMVDNPDGPKLQEKLETVHQVWTNALQGQFEQPNASVKAMLDASNYVQATMQAVQLKTPREARFAPSQDTGPAASRISQFNRSTVAAPRPMSVIHTVYRWITTPTPAVRTSVTLEDELKKAKAFQSFIIGFLVVIAGYGLQLNTFVGTFTDFSTLFFWAFAIDLTVDQVGRIIKNT